MFHFFILQLKNSMFSLFFYFITRKKKKSVPYQRKKEKCPLIFIFVNYIFGCNFFCMVKIGGIVWRWREGRWESAEKKLGQ